MQGNMRHTRPLFRLRLHTTPCVVVRFLRLVHVSQTETCVSRQNQGRNFGPDQDQELNKRITLANQTPVKQH